MTQYAFGLGALIGLRTDIANATPAQFGTLQEVQLDMSFTIKELTGQFQAPTALARGGLKITGKAKAARITAANFNNLFFGQTVGNGNTVTQIGEAQAVPGSAAYTVQVANHATFAADLGVAYAASGVMLTTVAPGSEATGKYSVNSATGTYTFSSGDANAAILVTYSYTTTSGTAIALSNQLMGSQPSFRLVLSEQYQGKLLNLQLNWVISPKLSLQFKNEDFLIPEFDFQAAADAAGNIGNVWLSE
ncbi:MAG TPA: hypothetical protein VKZ79_03555 [Alphaproteobacteria bacterium]|nr:hypothetical protein [Alphaproteobacteria bacterium]